MSELCRARSIDAAWVLEESAEHPIVPRDLRRQSSEADFPDHCLSAWRRFIESNQGCVFLDGYALQSTVRFLFANDLSYDRMRAYFDAWQEIGGPNAAITYLRIENPAEHYERRVFPARGQDWVDKVSRYVARTPYGKKHNLRGAAGLIDFWSAYQRVCLDFLTDAPLARVLPEAVHRDPARRWCEDWIEATIS